MAVIKLRLFRADVLQSVNTFWQGAREQCNVYAYLHKHNEERQKATICRTMSDTVNECATEMGQWLVQRARGQYSLTKCSAKVCIRAVAGVHLIDSLQGDA